MIEWLKKLKHKKELKTAKELASERGEPWVEVISMDVDPTDLNNGAFELDWNEIFVARLIKAGYQGKDDSTLVDQWFQNICRNIVMETYEQAEAIK